MGWKNKGNIFWLIVAIMVMVLAFPLSAGAEYTDPQNQVCGGGGSGGGAAAGPLIVSGSNMSVSAHIDCNLSFTLCEGQSLTVGGAVYIARYNEQGNPSPGGVSDVTAAVYNPITAEWKNCDFDPDRAKITMPEGVNFAPNSVVQLRLHNVVNPPIAGNYLIRATVETSPNTTTYETWVTITAPAVKVNFDPNPIMAVAGEVLPITLRFSDQSGNPTPAQKGLGLSFHLVKDWVDDPNPAPGFYKRLDNDGKAVEPIEVLDVQQGTSSITVYYYSEEANGFPDKNQSWQWFQGLVELRVWGQVDSKTVMLQVRPNQVEKVVLESFEPFEFNGIKICDPCGGNDTYLSLPQMSCPENATTIVPNSDYDMRIGLQDKFGNWAVASEGETVTVNLSTSPENWDARFFYGDCRINQVPMDKGMVWEEIRFRSVYPDNISGSVFAEGFRQDAAGTKALKGASLELTVLGETKGLAVYMMDRFLPDNYETWSVGKARTWADLSTPVIVGVVDDKGRPTRWNGENKIKVNLSSVEGTFYTDNWGEVVPISEIEIPPGYNGIKLYYKRNQSENVDPVTATADGLTTGKTEVEIFPHWIKVLSPGWNVISTPVELSRAHLDQVIADLFGNQKSVEMAYSFNSSTKKWQQVYKNPHTGKWLLQQGDTCDYTNDPEYLLKPLEALYLKIRENTMGYFMCYPTSSPTGPYVTNLKPGWNLVGPAIDIANRSFYHLAGPVMMPVNDLIASVSGPEECVQVISPGLGYNPQWYYVPSQHPGIFGPPAMAGGGIWIYMKNEGNLAGFSTTPLPNPYEEYFWRD